VPDSCPTHCCFKPPLETMKFFWEKGIFKNHENRTFNSLGRWIKISFCQQWKWQLLHVPLCVCLLTVAINAAAQTDTTDELLLKFKPRTKSLSLAQKQKIKIFTDSHCIDTGQTIIIFGAGYTHPKRSWKRIENIIKYLTKKNGDGCTLSYERIGFGFDGVDSEDEVLLRWGDPDDEGPNMIPAPHPQYHKQ
jgi:hypothetical protein